MKIKFNWGFGILIAIILFMGTTVALVTISFHQKTDLVTDHYYEKTLKYQNQIDMEKRSVKFDKDLEITNENNEVNIKFPDEFKTVPVKGELYFYRPSDAANDFTVPLQVDQKGSQVISSAKMKKGFWQVKVEWVMAKKITIVKNHS